MMRETATQYLSALSCVSEPQVLPLFLSQWQVGHRPLRAILLS